MKSKLEKNVKRARNLNYSGKERNIKSVSGNKDKVLKKK